MLQEKWRNEKGYNELGSNGKNAVWVMILASFTIFPHVYVLQLECYKDLSFKLGLVFERLHHAVSLHSQGTNPNSNHNIFLIPIIISFCMCSPIIKLPFLFDITLFTTTVISLNLKPGLKTCKFHANTKFFDRWRAVHSKKIANFINKWLGKYYKFNFFPQISLKIFEVTGKWQFNLWNCAIDAHILAVRLT